MTSRACPCDPPVSLAVLLDRLGEVEPARVAVRTPSETCSYGALHARAAHITAALRALGVPVGAMVGVCVPRSVVQIASMVAVLRARCVYFGLLPADPVARHATVLADTHAAAVLTTAELAPRFVEQFGAGARTSSLAAENGDNDLVVVARAEADCKPLESATPTNTTADDIESIVYCTFTSGSTGTPKGILLSHRALSNFINGMCRFEKANSFYSGFASVLQLSRCTFDISFFEAIGPLLFGGTTVLMPATIDRDGLSGDALLTALSHGAVTWTFMVPAVARTFLDVLRGKSAAERESLLPALRALYLGGEMVPLSLARELASCLPRCRVINGYGPAECTIFSALHVFDASREHDSLEHQWPIGAATPGYACHVLDDSGAPVAAGQAGVLHIGGGALFSGYLNRPEETALVRREHPQLGLLYNSGDLVRVRASDGALVFAGRADHQVKVRGQRIELGEVEAAMRSAAGVKEAALIVRDDGPDRKMLVAYVEATSETETIDTIAATVLEHCRAVLPAYMVPAVVLFPPPSPSDQRPQHQLPRNNNGKLDRVTLAALDRAAHPLPIGIVGGGVAGILTALACSARGLPYVLIEQAPRLGGVWSNGTAGALSTLQQPGEYYELSRRFGGPLPRYATTAELDAYLDRIVRNGGVSDHALLRTRLEHVTQPAGPEAPLLATLRHVTSGATSQLHLDGLIVATGRCNFATIAVPAWASALAALPATAAPVLVPAYDVASVPLANKHVVVVGGGPYGVESVRVAVQLGAASVTLVTRRAHWVIPRSWHESPVLTRLYWRLFGGGLALSPGLVRLARVALARHYLRAGLGHVIPSLALTDCKSACSDAFFELARGKKMSVVLDAVSHVDASHVHLASGAPPLRAEVVINACGFQVPRYDYLSEFAPLSLYMGSVLPRAPRIGFVAVGLADGVFPNPHTARPQIDLLLNHLQHVTCRRTPAEMSAWLEALPRGGARDEEMLGAAAHLAEQLAELRWQRARLAAARVEGSKDVNRSTTSAAVKTIESLPQADADVASTVMSVAGACGIAAALDTPLLTAGMDSLRAVAFRARLAAAFPRAPLPSIATLLWDLPTLRHVAEHVTRSRLAAPAGGDAAAGDSHTTLSNSVSVPLSLNEAIGTAPIDEEAPLLTREEALTYVAHELDIADCVAQLASAPLTLITRICTNLLRIVPFQSFTLLAIDLCHRRLPSHAQIKRDVMARRGGCCYVLNVWIRELLRGLGLETLYVRAAIHGVEDCHLAVVVRGAVPRTTLDAPPSLHLIDVGCGYVMPQPVDLNFTGDETPVYRHGFLRLKYVRSLGEERGDALTLWRLHADASTFDTRELTLQRPDRFSHVFWRMSLRARPLHDKGESSQTRAYVSYGKLRAAIAVGEQARMVYFKADNHHGALNACIMRDVDGHLVTARVGAADLLRQLVEHFPAFTPAALGECVARLGCHVPEPVLAPSLSDRMAGRLRRLYGDQAEAALSSITALVEKWRGPIAASYAQERARTPGPERGGVFSHEDVIMIAYGDHLYRGPSLQQPSEPPLRTLVDFCTTRLPGLLSGVHLLPFHPSTAYDGYAITDYHAVCPRLGGWDDVARLGEAAGLKLMFDLVLNHCSASHPWFQQMLRDEAPGKDFFITRYTPEQDGAWLAEVKRARNLPLLYPIETAAGRKHYWATYFSDLVDVNWAHPGVAAAYIDVLLGTVSRGARLVRLDAFAYTWKSPRTTCVNLPETKVILGLLRDALEAAGAPRVAVLPSITNVTQAENFAYLNPAQGAHLVYHLPLSALLLHTLYAADTSVLRRWLRALPEAPVDCALLNLAASHDGVGLTWCVGILSDAERDHVLACARARGGHVAFRAPSEANPVPQPWEINITYFSACAPDAVPAGSPARAAEEEARLHAARLAATQSIVVALRGVPALYLSLFVAGENDHAGVEAMRRANVDPEAVCLERALNRARYSADTWEAALGDPTRPQSHVLAAMQRLLRARKLLTAFHPEASQHVPTHPRLPAALMVIGRVPPAGRTGPAVACLTNFSTTPVALDACTAIELLREAHFSCGGGLMRDVLEGDLIDVRHGLSFAPYQIRWLVDAAQASAALGAPTLAHFAALARTAPCHVTAWAARSVGAVVGDTPWASAAISPAATLGLTLPHSPLPSYEAIPLRSPQGQAMLEQLSCGALPPGTKLVHFVRHGHALHDTHAHLAAGAHGARCRCYDPTVPDRVTALQPYLGTATTCPHLSPAVMDDALTSEGVAAARELRGLRPAPQLVLSDASSRTLQTAALAFAPNLMSEDGSLSVASEETSSHPTARVVVTELLRAMVSPHAHSWRHPLSIQRALFPGADFSRVAHEEDTCAAALAGGAGAPFHSEARGSMDARVAEALRVVMSQKESVVALVTHFTVLMALFMRGDDGRVMGPREGDTAEPAVRVAGGGEPMLRVAGEDAEAAAMRDPIFGKNEMVRSFFTTT